MYMYVLSTNNNHNACISHNFGEISLETNVINSIYRDKISPLNWAL